MRASAPSLLVYAVALVFAIVAAVAHPTYYSWMQEDAWAEWSTFVAFLIAAALFPLREIDDELEGWRRLLAQASLVLLGLFCLTVAGEEISWGQRLLGFTPPELFLEQNYQQELNLHNFTAAQSGFLGIPTQSRHLVAYFAVAYGVLGPILARFLDFARPAAPPPILVPLFCAIAVVEWTYPVRLTGEAAELTVGLALIAAARLRRPRLHLGLVALAVALGPVLSFGTGLLHREDAERTVAAREELERIGEALLRPGAVHPTLLSRSYVHQRIFTASQRFLRLPESFGYFIDPWGNPYWLLYRGGGGDIWLYSFGANRKRDLRSREGIRGGDDVIIELALPR